MSTIPVVDLNDAAAAAQLDRALCSFGFVQVTGHGIDPSVFAGAHEQMATLMSRPVVVLEALRDPMGHPFYGLVPHGMPDDPDAIACHQFEINRFSSPDEASACGVPDEYLSHFGHNLWPDDMPAFRPAIERCFHALQDFAAPLLSLFATALGMPSDFFSDYMVNDSTSLGVGRYPWNDWVAPGSEVLAWHTDRETLVSTLHQRGNYQGLQIRTLAGEIVAVPVVDDALVVNVGQLFEKWTSGRWRATPHRVVSGAVPGDSRGSIVNFLAPDVTRQIQPLLAAGGGIDPTAPSFNVFDLAIDLPRFEVNA